VASITSYFSFYLIEKFHVSVRSAQVHLFVFLLAMALGTLFGGPLGDRIGRKRVIWVSILGIAPFALILPYVDLGVGGRSHIHYRLDTVHRHFPQSSSSPRS